ncbi:MAG TPA: hypothetical protein VNW29_07490 [Candidatus Sulfotelmatobacter sp.]|jgi:hypothetical protein|nr:hypothetical protein [Candidatus Sulfotelmatobacter sp.]
MANAERSHASDVIKPPRFKDQERKIEDFLLSWRANQLTIVHGPRAADKRDFLGLAIPGINLAKVDLLPVGRVDTQQTAKNPSVTTVVVPEESDLLPDVISPANDGYHSPNPYLTALLASWSTPNEPIKPDITISDFLRKRTTRIDKHGEQLPVLGLIVGFENLYVDNMPKSPGYYDEFITQLGEAFSDPRLSLRLAISVEDDTLAGVQADVNKLTRLQMRASIRILPVGVNLTIAPLSPKELKS